MEKKIIAAICSAFVLNGPCIAGKPVFIVSPNISAPSSMFSGETGTAVYQVTNNTPYNFTNIGLAQMPGGVIANTNAVSPLSQYCSNPFSLTAGSSCLLKVQLNTNQLGTSVTGGPKVCFSQTQPVYCSQPFAVNQLNTSISQQAMPQDCNSNYANFNYELLQNLDSSNVFSPGWGPGRTNLPLSPANPNLTNCATTAGVTWQRNRVIAAAAYWIAQKLNYCHHYNPDYATPSTLRGAAGNAGGYCNPAVDSMPGSVYYGQIARWNYTGQGSETANNWVNNNQMWYGMDCSNTTSFIYNFALNIPFDSKTGYQAGQQSTGCDSQGNNCPQDNLSPNEQIPSNPAQVLNNPNEAGLLVCNDGTTDPNPSSPSMCTGHGGYLSGISSGGCFTQATTVAQVAAVLKPGDLLYIAGAGGQRCGQNPPNPQPNPDGSTSEVTHVIMWIGKQVGYGPNDINPALVAPDDAPCADQSIWQPQVGDWVIADSHYQGYDYRKLTTCFYLNDLWGVRRVIN